MQTIVTKYFAPTNTRGSRIKVTSWLGSKTYTWDYALDVEDNHNKAFYQWLEEQNKEMASKYPDTKDDEWFKMVAKGNMPDGSGYAYVIK